VCITNITYAPRDRAKVAKEKVERDNITLLQKFIFAMDYEKIAEYTFKVIEVSLCD
jgi:hypothetical protein